MPDKRPGGGDGHPWNWLRHYVTVAMLDELTKDFACLQCKFLPTCRKSLFVLWIPWQWSEIHSMEFEIASLNLPWEQSLISPRVENKALPFLCLICVAHALFPISCQNMSKITCIFRMIAKYREPITCSYRYMLGACNCTCCTITTI